jgi:hypothetical protein
MELQNSSELIKHLTSTFIKVLIERTGGELKIPLKFVDIYNDACIKRGGINNKYEINIEMRHYVRDNLMKNGYIFVDPKDVDSIYLTRKAIDEYSGY